MCLTNGCFCTRLLFEKLKMPYWRLFLLWCTLDNLINSFKATFQQIVLRSPFSRKTGCLCAKEMTQEFELILPWAKDTECHIICLVFVLESLYSKCQWFCLNDFWWICMQNIKAEVCRWVCWMNTERSSALALLIMILWNLKF